MSNRNVCACALLTGAMLVAATAAAGDRMEVKFQSADVTIVGDLLLPPLQSCRRCPALVVIHGSGDSDRSNPWTDAWASALVDRGIAVLYPDKRGSGESGGDWRKASFATLAGDAVAGVDLLKSHPRVDPQRLGVIGFSQGGQIAPLAASLSPDVRLVVDVSGAIVPLGEEIFDEIRMDAEKAGLDVGQIALLRDIHETILALARTGEGREEYERLIDEAKDAGLGGTPFVDDLPRDPSLWVWSWLADNAPYDPMPYWRRIGRPALIIYGGADENVDTAKSLRRIEADLLAKDGDNLSILYLGGNHHALVRDDATDFVAEWARSGGAH